jgi:hypothetical protein
VKRARYLAVVRPGDLRDGLRVKLTASLGERVVQAQSTRPAAAGLVWLTVTEVTRLWLPHRAAPASPAPQTR